MSELSCDTLFIGRNETHDLSLYSGTLNQAVYVLRDKYLGQAYFPGSVGAEK